jgi:ribosomal protein S18 acetylase RimI-like enzyme
MRDGTRRVARSSAAESRWRPIASSAGRRYQRLVGSDAVRRSLAHTIRPARADELPSLAAIERAAGRRFDAIPALAGIPEDPTSLDELAAAQAGGLVWVAATPEGRLVGFAHAVVIDGCCHLEEIDVLEEFGRRGVGRALVEAVCAHAAAAGLAAVTLTTFRDVPWNAPFYARVGFEAVAPGALSPGLARVVREEAARGLPERLRVVMRRRVATGGTSV